MVCKELIKQWKEKIKHAKMKNHGQHNPSYLAESARYDGLC
jgi:hypothetical protein